MKRKNGEDVEKRDLVVEDETGEIYVTVWGEDGGGGAGWDGGGD